MISLIFLIGLLFGNNSDLSWNILQQDSILIQYIQEEFPLCETQMVIDGNIEDILIVIEDISNYKLFFDSIIISEINSKDEVRLALNMPFPFSDRDYTIKFSKINDESNVRFLYKPVVSDYFPQEKHFIRLINAQGGWYINYVDSIHTKVIYRWNGEMLGNFPRWAYTKAWIKQGNEIMSNLNQEVKRRKK